MKNPACVNRRPMRRTLLPLLMLLTATPMAARAQLLERYLPQSVGPYEADPITAVLQQEGADYRQPDIRLGSFLLAPQATETAGFNQNPLGLASGAKSTPLLDSAASLSVQSDWTRNALGASVSIDNTRYFNVPVANTTASTAFIGGSLDIADSALMLGVGHVSGNLSPTDVLTFGLAAPVPYQANDVRASYTVHLARLDLTPALDLSSYRFGRATAGRFVVDDTGLDKNQIEGSLTGKYIWSDVSNLTVVLRGTNGQLLHNHAAGNYTDAELLAGIDVTHGLLRWDLLVGAEHRQFQGPITAIDTPVVEFAMIYTPTRLTTVTVRFSREIADPTYNVTNDLTYTSGRLIADYAFRRNIVLQGRVRADLGDANSGGGSRTNLDFGASGTWLINRTLSLSADYDYAWDQGSNAGAYITNPSAPAGPDPSDQGNGGAAALHISTASASVHVHF